MLRIFLTKSTLMKKLVLSLLLLTFLCNLSFAQERMIIKPNGFDPSKIAVTQLQNIQVTTEIKKIITTFGIAEVYPNVRIVPTTGNQTELSATIWKSNPNYVFVGANSDPGQGYYFTTNGGTSWSGGDLLPGSVAISSDPACVFDNTGRLYFNYFDNAMICDRSTNGGSNWLGRVTVPSTSFDKNHMAVDDNPASPYYGRVYVVWANFTPSSPPTVISYSTNNGVSFSAMQQIGSPLSGHYEQGCNVQIAPNGDVYCIWACPSSGVLTEDFIGFTKSTNGGVTWSSISYIDINGIRGNILSTNIRVNSFPSMAVDRSGGSKNGYIYITWTQKNLAPAGSDADIVFCYSSNGGNNWSAPVRVNDDPINNGKQQFFPWMTVDQTNGNISIVFYDTRDVSSADSCHTYVAYSQNGGSSFTNIKVSDMAQRPAPLSGYATGYYGDYIAITAHNNVIWPFWMDKRVGPAQVYTAKITIGPAINHTPLTNTELTTGNRVVNASIIPAGSGINPGLTKLFYAKNNTAFASVPLTNTSGTNWTANLPLTGAGTYNYYLTTTDSLIRTATSPAGAPANYYSFTASSDTTKPIIVTTPLANVPKSTWPPTVTATATDNIGIDSVWVKWYKNTTSTGIKQFKLLNTSGSIYAAAFNSDTSQVAVNDSIFYRVFARDISSAHNSDSTALYKFKIINQVTTTIGTGTTLSNYPFTTYWKDGRTQYLYLASELNLPSGYIAQIGFDVINADPGAMNAFKVSMQNTSLSTMTGFVTTGWNTAFAPSSYTVPGTGWQMITLASPFYYSAGSNLLVEVCYNNSAYTDYSTVNSTPATGMFYGKYNDLTEPGDGCATTTWTSTANPPGRANTRFVFNPGPTTAGNNNPEIPSVYSLSQNYPNPFNPVTKINFAIPKQGLVTLKIYDVLGREVRTLVNEVKSVGTYAVDFNGAELSSGVYFYRLQSADFTDIKRMMLIK